MKKALLFGIGASFFFSFTFVLNRQMNIGGGNWYWSSSLRYLFMLPILFCIVATKQQLSPVIEDIKKNPVSWFIWSTVGWILLCSFKFCFSIWSFMAGSRNMAADYYCWCSYVSIFLHNSWREKNKKPYSKKVSACFSCYFDWYISYAFWRS